MICTSIQGKNLREIREILSRPDIEMAEIRLDRCKLSVEEIDELFGESDVPLAATCRTSECEAAEAEARLLTAIKAGAAYVDVEIEAPAMMSKRIRRQARESGSVLVRSYHDFKGTDSHEALKALVEKCLHLGADIVKIVTTASSEADAASVMSLYGDFAPQRLIAFCMGEAGRQTRIDCLKAGAPYTYAALSLEEAAAPGQWPYKEMREKVYGGRQFIGYPDCKVLSVPASKSFSQRAILCAALAEGVSHLRGYTPCGDSEAALKVARSLGAEVSEEGGTLTIKGIGAAPGSVETAELFTGESGLLTRMMIPLCAALGKGSAHISGEKTLVTRPLKGAAEMMAPFGISLESDRGGEEVMVPLTVKGGLRPCETEISGKDGSQLVSGLLMSLPLEEESSVIRLTEPKSIPYIFITIEVLKRFGIRIGNEMEGGEDFAQTRDMNLCDAITFHIRGGQRYRAADLDIEGDWSAAANLLVAGAIFGRTEVAGLDSRSLQADLSVMDVLIEAGASLSEDNESHVFHSQRAPLSPFSVDASNCPDLFPIIAVLAAFCEGRSRIGGVGRLAGKESDRASAITGMLTQMGVQNAVKGDELVIDGHSLARRCLEGKLLHGGKFTSRHDHRMVLALMTASLGADSPVEIDDTACVSKSFPEFGKVFARLTGKE